MGSAGTARFPAPAASFQVLPARIAALVVFFLHGSALANLLAWFHWAARPAAITIGFALLAWLASALISARACRRLPVGRLIWDTEGWSFERRQRNDARVGVEHDAEALGAAAEVAVDLQFCMLLHFGEASKVRWVFATRRHDPLSWLALRRAVYSPAMAVRLPTPANEFGAFPPA